MVKTPTKPILEHSTYNQHSLHRGQGQGESDRSGCCTYPSQLAIPVTNKTRGAERMPGSQPISGKHLEEVSAVMTPEEEHTFGKNRRRLLIDPFVQIVTECVIQT